jgi:trigger factor
MQELQVSVEAENGLERTLRVSVPAARVEREVESRLRNVARTARMKGFRPGKIPEKVLRQRFGDQVRREVLQDLVQSSYSEAVSRQKLRPAGGPRIKTENAASQAGADLTYTASFEVFPEFELRGLEGLRAERPEAAIDADDEQFVILNLRRQRSNWISADRAARDGDRVIIDFEGTIDGRPIEGGKGESVTVVIGSSRLLPDFERQLANRSKGEDFAIRVNFPADYGNAEIAGRAADFRVRLHEVAEEQLPEFDADFIRAFGVESGAEVDFIEQVRQHMQQEFASRALADVKRQLLEALLAANPIAIPATLVENECASLQADAMRNLGITDVAAAPPLESFREAAERRVRLGLLIGAIIREHTLVADRDRIRQRIDQMAATYEKPEEIRKIYYQNTQLMSQVEQMVLEDQVVAWLTERASITPRPSSFRALVTT